MTILHQLAVHHSKAVHLQGSVFSAVMGELLDAVRWPANASTDSPKGSPKPSRIPSQSLSSVGASPAAVSARREAIATATLAAHPYRPLYLSGQCCLWQDCMCSFQ